MSIPWFRVHHSPNCHSRQLHRSHWSKTNSLSNFKLWGEVCVKTGPSKDWHFNKVTTITTTTLTSEAVYEILKCYHWDESYWAVLACGTVYKAGSNFWIRGRNHKAWSFKSYETISAMESFSMTTFPSLIQKMKIGALESTKDKLNSLTWLGINKSLTEAESKSTAWKPTKKTRRNLVNFRYRC